MEANYAKYKCTFVDMGCKAEFRNEAAWKAHEEDNHLIVESWQCPEKAIDKPAFICNKAFFLLQHFKDHLRDDHQMDVVFEADLESCHFGRGGRGQFWCGYCRSSVITVMSAGVSGWHQRQAHMSRHHTVLQTVFPPAELPNWMPFDSRLR